MSNRTHRKPAPVSPDPQLEQALRMALGLGLVLVALLPVARGSTDWLGWMPMWLVGMPAVALWSLHRFRVPLRRATVETGSQASLRRRRSGAQARRRAAPVLRQLPRVA